MWHPSAIRLLHTNTGTGRRAVFFAMLAVCLAVFTFILPATSSAAVKTAPVAIGATVLSTNKCLLSAPSAVLSFGTLDPAVAVLVTVSTTMTFNCKGKDNPVFYTITHDNGLNSIAPGATRMINSAAVPVQYLPYTFTLLPSSGSVPKNVNTLLTIQGTIAAADYVNAVPGAYVDTVVITVNP